MSFQFSIRFPRHDVPHWAKHYSVADDDSEVREIGAHSREAGFYTRDDFLHVCKWKTNGRPQRHYKLNSDDEVRCQTAIALTSPDEEERMGSLRKLRGVSWPTASALLHLAHNEPYPILDLRALWSLQCASSNYTFEFWSNYVQACRFLAVDCGVSIRDLDRALWEYSRINQPKTQKAAELPVEFVLLAIGVPML